jgi:site-specific DNA-methyltransferase (adenine-specific)
MVNKFLTATKRRIRYNTSMESLFADIKDNIFTDVVIGDSKKVLQKIQGNSIDLVVTSPPYADNRKKTYGGIHPDDYVAWMLPVTKELLRVLKPTGTFILNIKEKTLDGERHTYVLELILEMRKQGWLWTEEFIWHKRNCFPGHWPNRFRDAWERLLQFNKTKKFNMYQKEVMVPVGDWSKTRLKNLSEVDLIRDNTKNGSGFGKKISNWIDREKVYPTNVLHLPTECFNRNHSAVFPEALPEWFIKLFTQETDLVLDPFVGSGTTLKVAQKLNRNSIGIDILPDYLEIVKERTESSNRTIFLSEEEYYGWNHREVRDPEICLREYQPVSCETT